MAKIPSRRKRGGPVARALYPCWLDECGRTARTLLRLIIALSFPCMLPLSSANVMNLTWDELPPLPPSAGQAKQPGVAGPFAGVHGDALIVAGGANFPDKMPWEGGTKVWWDDIWVL